MSLILGADKSGKSLLAAILNCSPNVNLDNFFTDKLSFKNFKKEGIGILDALHMDYGNEQKFIWILRDPLESACSMNKNGIPRSEALSYWADINTIIWYFLQSIPQDRKIKVHFESLILKDSLIKSVFGFCGIMFDKQYFNYGDFDQFDFDDPSFRLGFRDGEKVNFYNHDEKSCSQWEDIKNKKIIIQFGYTRSRYVNDH